MEKNTEVIYGLIERMALVSDAIDSLFVNGKKVIVIELNKFDFEQTKRQFKNVDPKLNQFKICLLKGAVLPARLFYTWNHSVKCHITEHYS